MPRRVFLFCILLLALAVLYTLGSAFVTVQRIERLDAAGRSTAGSLQVLSALYAFATAAADIDGGARGYALTGSESYLQPFEAARREAPMRLDELRDLLRDEPKQLERVERLTSLLAERISLAELAIAQKRGAPDEPFAMRFGPRSRDASDEIRRTVDDIASDERQDLAARKLAWQQELESARTTEALTALSSLTVITLSLWALLRLRRIEAPSPASHPATPAQSPPPPPLAADYDTLVDDTLHRAALLQASHPGGSAERARVALLREAVEHARAGVSASQSLLLLERIGLPLALSALAQAIAQREHCTVRQSIDASSPNLAASHALLAFRVADWALTRLCAGPAGELGIGLAADEAGVVLRIEGPARADAGAADITDERGTALAREVTAAGGAWHWNAGDAARSLTLALPVSNAAERSAIAPESTRA
jgi:CHASE3 domain sensor protein